MILFFLYILFFQYFQPFLSFFISSFAAHREAFANYAELKVYFFHSIFIFEVKRESSISLESSYFVEALLFFFFYLLKWYAQPFLLNFHL
jgi:hypothetical protein